MLEDLLIGSGLCTILAFGILFVRNQRRLYIARMHREHLLALIGLPNREADIGLRRWRAHFRLRQPGH